MRVGAAHCDQCRSQAQVDARRQPSASAIARREVRQSVASTRVARRPIGRPSLRQAPKHAQQGIVSCQKDGTTGSYHDRGELTML